MSRQIIKDNKYKPGDVVYAKVNPSLELKIRRYTERIYYCQVLDNPALKELVYYERELVEDPELLAKNSASMESGA
ncbi:hypothetical protein [Reichenbachiella ulvae]|uniref:Uncharacterized protein n=1 Tax=Reichenbachiella ulvae TaxID=2980104 RepID=A0ABT3CQY0_9BACT|nr:hypothetical protein [Reichenbachiella ulvae]MCV9385981.1 hypothetical protein [Reichenbachiella ulvae]